MADMGLTARAKFTGAVSAERVAAELVEDGAPAALWAQDGLFARLTAQAGPARRPRPRRSSFATNRGGGR